MKQKVIIDCDNTMGLPDWEIDDGLVLLYLLGRDDIEIVGITNTFGNGSLQDVEFYTKQLLKEIGREDIPRFSGEAFANQNPGLILDIRAGDRYSNEMEPCDFPSPAAAFLAEQVDASPGEITILALGPVGNLHDAWKIDNDFYRKVREVVIMGGYTGELLLGNRPCRELNLSCNPSAASNLFGAECPVVVFNGHICLQAPFLADDMQRIAMWPEARLAVIRRWMNKFGSFFGEPGFYLWDLLPAVYLSHPDLFDLHEVRIAPTVESLHYGMLNPVGEGTEGVTVIMPDNILDRTRFMDILEAGWKRAWRAEKNNWGR